MLRFLLSVVIFCVSALALGGHAQARQTAPVDTGKVVASLVSSHDTVSAGETFYVALRTELDDGWHTYWRNPGDSGEPVQMDWKLPAGIEAGPIAWPLPKPIPTGPIINYGFEGAPLFPVAFTVPSNAQAGDILTLTNNFYYLVCKDVCIPEDGTLDILIKVGPREIDQKWAGEIERALGAVPVPMGVKASAVETNGALELRFKGVPAGADAPYFFPYEQGILGHSDAQVLAQGTDGIALRTTADYAWEYGTPETVQGVLAYTQNGVYQGSEVTLTIGEPIDIGQIDTPLGTAPSSALTFLPALVFAFLGGLILNLMPCVFPIISLKALSLSRTAHSERAHVRGAAWAYTLGVVATFLLLAGALIALKAGGSQIGWGFQLQSPKVVGLLALLLFVIGLNLLGFFEFGSGLQNTGQGLTQKSGFSGSFFTGALAVIVATPCTAPFMAGAMGYAIAQPALVTLGVFLALALGFAAPFLLLGYLPQLLAKLPKPGPWMVRFKELLAFPMLAAAIWLVWVLSQQAGADGVLAVLAAMLFVGFAIWLSKRSGGFAKTLAVLSVIFAIAAPLMLGTSSAKTVETQAWSAETVADLRAQGRPVFVDFTAAWCVTCKVNERLVLDRAETQKLFADTNTAFLIADWTNKDDIIAAELARYGRAGVPLYLVYHPDNNAVKGDILPQVLTYDVIRAALMGEASK